MSRYPGWGPTPLLEVLPDHIPSWWNPFAKKDTAEATRLALRFLAHRPCQAVTDRATILVRHRDPQVRKLARAIIDGADVTADDPSLAK